MRVLKRGAIGKCNSLDSSLNVHCEVVIEATFICVFRLLRSNDTGIILGNSVFRLVFVV